MIHPQAQKLLIAMKGESYTPNVKDILSAHKFSIHTHQNCKDGANTYIEIASKCDGLYPFIGNTLASLAFNLVNIGTSASTNKYLTFVGSPTPTVSGGSVPWNGTTQYADTSIPFTTVENRSNVIGYYSLTNVTTVGKTFDMGNIRGVGSMGVYLACRTAGEKFAANLNSTSSGLSPVIATSVGFFLSLRVGTTSALKMLINGVSSDSSSSYTTGTAPGNIFIGKIDSGNTSFHSIRTCAGSVIARDFTEAEGISLSNAFLNLNILK